MTKFHELKPVSHPLFREGEALPEFAPSDTPSKTKNALGILCPDVQVAIHAKSGVVRAMCPGRLPVLLLETAADGTRNVSAVDHYSRVSRLTSADGELLAHITNGALGAGYGRGDRMVTGDKQGQISPDEADTLGIPSRTGWVQLPGILVEATRDTAPYSDYERLHVVFADLPSAAAKTWRRAHPQDAILSAIQYHPLYLLEQDLLAGGAQVTFEGKPNTLTCMQGTRSFSVTFHRGTFTFSGDVSLGVLRDAAALGRVRTTLPFAPAEDSDLPYLEVRSGDNLVVRLPTVRVNGQMAAFWFPEHIAIFSPSGRVFSEDEYIVRTKIPEILREKAAAWLPEAIRKLPHPTQTTPSPNTEPMADTESKNNDNEGVYYASKPSAKKHAVPYEEIPEGALHKLTEALKRDALADMDTAVGRGMGAGGEIERIRAWSPRGVRAEDPLTSYAKAKHRYETGAPRVRVDAKIPYQEMRRMEEVLHHGVEGSQQVLEIELPNQEFCALVAMRGGFMGAYGHQATTEMPKILHIWSQSAQVFFDVHLRTDYSSLRVNPSLLRIGARQLTKLVKLPLEAKGVNMAGAWKTPLLQAFLSLGIEQSMPGHPLAKELRVEALADLGDSLLEAIAGPLREVLAGMTQPSAPAPAPELPAPSPLTASSQEREKEQA